jgi:hypothetical protein
VGALHAALTVVGLASVVACADEAGLAEGARAPASRSDPACMAAPAPVDDTFAQRFAESQTDDPYRTERARSVDLGAIGDAPLGRNPSPPHRPPAWQQPFPCHWTHTCVPLVYPPVVYPDAVVAAPPAPD